MQREVTMKNNAPMITTIIPTYRRPRLLKRSILSVLNQTYKNIRVCVYDNASGDETASVVAEIAKLDDRVEYFCHDVNIGPLKNYVYGLSRVETPYFSLFADDDYLLPNFYEDAVSEFERHKEAMFICLSTAIADQNGRVYWESGTNFKEGIFIPPYGLQELLKQRFISLPWTSILYRKGVIDQGVAIDLNLKLISDVDWGLKCCSKFPFVIKAKRGAVFSINSSLISFKNLTDDVWPDWKYISQNVMSNEETPLDIRIEVNKWLKTILLDNLKIITRDAILLNKFQQAHAAIDLIKNYCKCEESAEILLKKVIFYEHHTFIRKLYYAYTIIKYLYYRYIKIIFITHKFKKVEFK